MIRETRIIPAILVKDFAEFTKNVKLAEEDFSLLQIDVMDGQFVNNQTYFKAAEVESLPTKAQYELHLMVNDPLPIIKSVDQSKKISRIIFHLEPVADVAAVIKEIKKGGQVAGLALNPETPVSRLEPYLSMIDLVLLMTVNPGWAGQGLIETSYDKIRALRAMSQEMEIEVDGGVNPQNIKDLISAGVNSLAMGSVLFRAADFKATIQQLKNIIK